MTVVADMELRRKDTAARLATVVPVAPAVAMAAVVDRLVATVRLPVMTAAMVVAASLAEVVAAALVTAVVAVVVSAAAVVVSEIEVKTAECGK
jgi:hypothetical protein